MLTLVIGVSHDELFGVSRHDSVIAGTVVISLLVQFNVTGQ